MTSYNKLMEKYREIVLVNSIMRLMEWDLETHMPPLGVTLRSNQLGVLKRVNHRLLVNEEFSGLLKESQKDAESLDEVQRRNLYLIRREHDIETSVPESLVADLASQMVVARDAWFKAKMDRKWALFEPELRKLLDLSIKRAEATMHARNAACVYDAMIDDFDRGMTHQQVAGLLTGLKDSLMPLVRRYQEASREVDTSFTRRQIPAAIQRQIAGDITALFGYDTNSAKAWGRIDETEHPFTSGYFDDVRIAVHYHEDNLLSSVFGAIHEAGHALYERNLNHDWMYQPVGEGASAGMHEAMSRFAENMIGRSRYFWKFYFPRLKALSGDAFSDIGLEDLLRAINKVETSKIRVNSDEVTYSLHIVIRSEIERMLFEGRVEASELPQVWNDLYDKYLQVRFDHDGEGVLQDVHWSLGYFGLFQSYALGNVYGGMFLRKLEEQVSDWASEVEKGGPTVAINWLRDNIQHWGALYDPGELVKKVTGSNLTPEPFTSYLAQKHSTLWG
ncbi:MAG TPA: carboxypeptidase M32 [Thermoplasmata archaeon]